MCACVFVEDSGSVLVLAVRVGSELCFRRRDCEGASDLVH